MDVNQYAKDFIVLHGLFGDDEGLNNDLEKALVTAFYNMQDFGQRSAQDSIDRAEAGVEDCIDRLEEALRYIKSSLDSIKELKGEA